MAVSKSGGSAGGTKSVSRAKPSVSKASPSKSLKTGTTKGAKTSGTKVGTAKKSTPATTAKKADSTKISKEARSDDKLSPERQAHISALEKSLGIEVADSQSDAGGKDEPSGSSPSAIDLAQKGADQTKVAADRVKGAAGGIKKAGKAIKQSVGARTAVSAAKTAKATEQKSGKASKGLHGAAALTGAANIITNGASMNAPELAATGSGILADSAGALDNGGKAVSATSKFGKALGAVRTGASKVAGPLGIAAKGFEGANQMVNGATKGERVEGAFKTTAAVGTGTTSLAAMGMGAAKLAARTNVIGAAAISGIEGVGQIARAESTQDYIAGGLKTGAAAALTAAAVPGPHSVPLAVAGAGMYVGGMVADNWDSVTSAAGWIGNKVSSWF